MRTAADIIPPITHELGRNWEQPERSRIRIEGDVAFMTKATLDQLAEYSLSSPTGVYEGKMWKRQKMTVVGTTGGYPDSFRPTGKWYLVWYDRGSRSDTCSTCMARIKIVDRIDRLPLPVELL